MSSHIVVCFIPFSNFFFPSFRALQRRARVSSSSRATRETSDVSAGSFSMTGDAALAASASTHVPLSASRCRTPARSNFDRCHSQNTTFFSESPN